MDTQDLDAFPLPEKALNDRQSFHTFFEDELIYLYFIASSHFEYSTLKHISERVVETLRVFQKLDDEPSTGKWKQYFRLYYAFILHSRDQFIGKGLQTFSYMLIYAWHQVFPVLAINALEYFVYQYNDRPSFGSWRDMKYLCELVKYISPSGDQDPLIKECVSILNKQLNVDIHTWNYSIHCRSPEHITMVSKWIPRENKRFHWLHTQLVEEWGKITHPNILKTAVEPTSYFKAISKVKRLYRKKIAMLNKAVDTLEIFLCKKNFYDIPPHSIPRLSFHKVRELHTKLHTDEYSNKSKKEIHKCLQNYQDFYNDNFSRRHHEKSWFSTVTPGYYVKEALHILKSPHIDNNYRKKICDEWNKNVDLLHSENKLNVYPVVDISLSMRKNNCSKLYDAIGLALVIAHHSSCGKRILALDNKPIWINFEECGDFVSTIKYLFEIIDSHLSSNCHFFNAVTFLTYSMKYSSTFVHNMKLVFLSDFDNSDDFFERFPQHIEQSFKTIQCNIPKVAFWNIGMEKSLPLHREDLDNHFLFLSGNSFHCLNSLQQCFEENHSSFFMIQHILQHPRYRV